jgi:hypothetical protein
MHASSVRNSAPRAAVYVSPSQTLIDGVRYAAPQLAGSLGEFLNRLASKLFGAQGVVLLDGDTCRLLGLHDPDNADAILTAARTAGWDVDKLGRWSTFSAKGRPTVYVGLLPLIDPEWFPLWAPDPADTTGSLALWHELTGSAYHHSPGAAGISMLIDGTRYATAWRSDSGPTRDVGAFELALKARDWYRPRPGTFAHGYDKTTAGLAAATCTLLPRKALSHTPGAQWRPNVAGWFKIERPPWHLADRMPDPIGPGKDGQEIVWVTHPTMALLHELADQGVYAAPRVVDAFTAPTTEVGKNWADRLSVAIKRCQGLLSERDSDNIPTERAQDAVRVLQALRDCAGQSQGLVGSPTSARCRRWDWHCSWNAMQRCNAWRTGWRVSGGPAGGGPCPISIDGDKLTYASDAEDAVAACPKGITLGRTTGRYHHEGTRQL